MFRYSQTSSFSLFVLFKNICFSLIPERWLSAKLKQTKDYSQLKVNFYFYLHLKIIGVFFHIKIHVLRISAKEKCEWCKSDPQNSNIWPSAESSWVIYIVNLPKIRSWNPDRLICLLLNKNRMNMLFLKIMLKILFLR